MATTYKANYPLKTTWQLHLVVDETTLDAVNNRSWVDWDLYIYRGSADSPYNNSGSAFSVAGPDGASGTFPAFRFGGTGSGTNYSGIAVGGRVRIASGGAWVAHNANGTGSVNVSASHAAAATLGTASISTKSFPLTTLRQIPGTPTDLAAAWVSDTQIALSWLNHFATNGAPTASNVQASINGGAFAPLLSIAPAEAVGVASAANRKTTYQVNAQNAAGASAWSDAATVFTTPAAPTGVTAAKSGANIIVGWANQVAFAEYQTVVWHGTMVGSTITWDVAPLATVAAGATSFTHVAPNNAQVHVYRVQAKNTDTGALASALVESNSVQLLAPPNAPTLGALPTYANRAAALQIPWTHNPVDTTAQTAYELSFSTDGGVTWSSTGKQLTSASSHTVAANTYAAGVTRVSRVRTWGAATTGGSDGTGASPWSTNKSVTFKSLPTVSIVKPANGATIDTSALAVDLAFAQPEGAAFVQATIGLYSGATLLEQVNTTTLVGTTFNTRLADSGTYTVKATVKDSNGLTSTQASSTFSVDYIEPVPAQVTATYLRESGIAQLDILIPAPAAGQAAAVKLTITREIDGQVDVVVDNYPVIASLTILDMTPTIHGTNVYTVTTASVDGATVDVETILVTTEHQWAFLNSGTDFATVVSFFGNLKFGASPVRSMALVAAAGRSRPIALYGAAGSLEVSGSATIVAGMGSTPQELEAFLLEAGTVCYRDPSGRRMFGAVAGSIDSPSNRLSGFSYKVTETS